MAPRQVREERRAQILDAMYAVIAERGVQGASVSEIADAAGVARGALHYFFASKDEITSALMRRLGDRYLDQLSAALERRIDEGKTAQIVGDLARWHFRGDAGDASRRFGVWIDFWGQAASQPDIRNVVVEIQDGARAILGRAIVAQRPELRGVELRPFATALLALIEGTLLQWRLAVASPAPLDRDEVGRAVAASAHAIARSIPPCLSITGGSSPRIVLPEHSVGGLT